MQLPSAKFCWLNCSSCTTGSANPSATTTATLVNHMQRLCYAVQGGESLLKNAGSLVKTSFQRLPIPQARQHFCWLDVPPTTGQPPSEQLSNWQAGPTVGFISARCRSSKYVMLKRLGVLHRLSKPVFKPTHSGVATHNLTSPLHPPPTHPAAPNADDESLPIADIHAPHNAA